MAIIRGKAGRDVLRGTNGPDRIFGNSGNDALYGNGGNDQIYGGAGNDRLDGGTGNDILRGEAGTDTLVGGTGNDTFYWTRGDRIIEARVGGVADRAIVNDGDLRSFTLANYVEKLTIQDAEINAVIRGNASNNIIDGRGTFGKFYGLAGNDSILGGSGVDADDYIDGGIGADNMQGFSGEDIYIVDNVGDVVSEVNLVGDDTVRSSVSYTVPTYVERLELTGTAAVNATGTAADDEELVGNSGANRMTGLGGGDELWGGLGGDRFVYTHIDDSTFRITGGLDRVYDFAAGQGDLVDLTALDWNTGNGGDDAFAYIDEAAFSAPGQVRVRENYSDGFTGLDGILVEVNTAGTGTAEMSIFLAGATGADATWFDL